MLNLSEVNMYLEVITLFDIHVTRAVEKRSLLRPQLLCIAQLVAITCKGIFGHGAPQEKKALEQHLNIYIHQKENSLMERWYEGNDVCLNIMNT